MRKVLFLLVLLVFTGCQSVSTKFDVTGPATAKITSVYTLEVPKGEFLSDESQKSIIDFYVRELGREPDVSIDGSTYVYSMSVSLEELNKASSIIGVSNASLLPDGESTKLSFEFVEPVALNGAIRSYAETQPDTDPLVVSIFSLTSLEVEVHFEGGVETIEGDNDLALLGLVSGDDAYFDNNVLFSQDLDSFRAGNISVTGVPQSPGMNWLLFAAVAVAVFSASYLVYSYSRRSRS